MPTSPRKTRVRGFRRCASGQTSSRRRCRSMFTPGSRVCGYKTVSGRHEWLNRDPIGELGGLNLYAYVGNNPIDLFDPLGLEYQITIGFGGTLSAIGVTGLPSISGGVAIGFTTSGQIIFQGTGAQMNAGTGVFAGGGLSLGVSHTDCPTPAGKSRTIADHYEGNLGYELEGGFATDHGTDGTGLSFPFPKLKIGVGFGGMLGSGTSGTTTYATPPLFPTIGGTIYTPVTNVNSPPNTWSP